MSFIFEGVELSDIFNPDLVFQELVAFAEAYADRLNARNVAAYFKHYEDVKRNWAAQRRKIEHRDPARQLAVEADRDSWSVKTVITDVHVTPKQTDPWDDPGQQDPVPGTVKPGPVIIGTNGVRSDAGSNVPPGHEEFIGGLPYRFFVGRGALGMPLRLWIPIGVSI